MRTPGRDFEEDEDYLEDEDDDYEDDIAVYRLPPPPVVTYYGTVTGRRVTFSGKGRGRGSAFREDLAIRHIASIREVTDRKQHLGIVLAGLGVYVLFFTGESGLVLLGFILAGLGYFLFQGRPSLIITTAQGEQIRVTGSIWRDKEIVRFAEAIRKKMSDHR